MLPLSDWTAWKTVSVYCGHCCPCRLNNAVSLFPLIPTPVSAQEMQLSICTQIFLVDIFSVICWNKFVSKAKLSYVQINI